MMKLCHVATARHPKKLLFRFCCSTTVTQHDPKDISRNCKKYLHMDGITLLEIRALILEISTNKKQLWTKINEFSVKEKH